MKTLGRIFVVGLVFAQLAGVLGWGAQGVAAQVDGSTYTDPQGRFTMEWQAPWEVLQHQGDLPMLGDGSLVVIPVGSMPVASLDLDACVQLIIFSFGNGEESSYPVLAEGKSTWRAWIVYQNDTIGLGEYFECQIVPDGSGFAGFAGGIRLTNFSDDLVRLTDFLGTTIVQPQGESAPALAGDGWRAGIVEWRRGADYSDLGLAAKDGKDWVIAVVDITNQQAAAEDLSLKTFAVRDVNKSGMNKASTRDSNLAAAALGEAPQNGASSLTIPAGTTRRAVLVFLVSASAKDLAFSFAERELRLSTDGLVRFGTLRPPAQPAAFEAATVTKVLDGRTLAVTLNESGEAATLRLIGLTVPVKDECYASEAKKQLATLAGDSILLESDASINDGGKINRHVWTGDGGLLISEELVRGGFATATSDEHRFQAMYSASEQRASAELAGMWTECHQDPERIPAPDVPVTEADPNYLAGLQDDIRLLDLSMLLIGPALEDGFVEEGERQLLGTVLVGVGVTEYYVGLRTPPTEFEALQTAYLEALRPLTVAIRTFGDLDGSVAEYQVNGGKAFLAYTGAEIDVAALSAAYESTKALLAGAQIQLDAALEEAGI